MSGKEQIVFHASEGFKDRLGAYAAEHKTTMAEVLRQATSDLIGWDLAGEPARSRTHRYATKEEEKRATYDRAALMRWGKTTGNRLLANLQVEAATIIARAVMNKDYETLALLKGAAALKLPNANPELSALMQDEDEEAIDAAE